MRTAEPLISIDEAPASDGPMSVAGHFVTSGVEKREAVVGRSTEIVHFIGGG